MFREKRERREGNVKCTVIVFKFLFQKGPWCPKEVVHSVKEGFIKISEGGSSDPNGGGRLSPVRYLLCFQIFQLRWDLTALWSIYPHEQMLPDLGPGRTLLAHFWDSGVGGTSPSFLLYTKISLLLSRAQTGLLKSSCVYFGRVVRGQVTNKIWSLY